MLHQTPPATAWASRRASLPGLVLESSAIRCAGINVYPRSTGQLELGVGPRGQQRAGQPPAAPDAPGQPSGQPSRPPPPSGSLLFGYGRGGGAYCQQGLLGQRQAFGQVSFDDSCQPATRPRFGPLSCARMLRRKPKFSFSRQVTRTGSLTPFLLGSRAPAGILQVRGAAPLSAERRAATEAVFEGARGRSLQPPRSFVSHRVVFSSHGQEQSTATKEASSTAQQRSGAWQPWK